MRSSKRSEHFTAAENIPHAEVVENILVFLRDALARHYGKRLVSVVVYGSVGRGTPRPDSDVDLFIVAEDLPIGRLRRMEEFRPIEKAYEAFMETCGGISRCPFRRSSNPQTKSGEGAPFFGHDRGCSDLVRPKGILSRRIEWFPREAPPARGQAYLAWQRVVLGSEA